MGKCCLWRACENPVGLSICDGPMKTVFISSWVSLDMRGWLAGIGSHTGCKGVSDYSCHCGLLGAIITDCIGVCLEKTEGAEWAIFHG